MSRQPQTWFTSDLHLGHAKVAGLRGFITDEKADTDAHDRVVLESIREHVGPEDILWVLGDVTANPTKSSSRITIPLDPITTVTTAVHEGRTTAKLAIRQAVFPDFFRNFERPNNVGWIAGNHDADHPMNAGEGLTLDKIKVPTMMRDERGKQRKARKIMLSHFPYSGTGSDRGEERYPEWRPNDAGLPLIHGHTHMTDQRFHLSDRGSMQIHVGWDAWERPVSLTVIAALFDEYEASAAAVSVALPDKCEKQES